MKIKLPADSSRIRGNQSSDGKKRPALCVRRGLLPEPCRMLQPRYRDLYDPRRDLYPAVARSVTSRMDAGRAMQTSHKSWRKTIADMGLRYVVVTSVDRDDLRDGGAQHFADCISAIREKNPSIKIETLVPDFRGRMDRALDILTVTPPDVFNHNLENVPRLYRQVRPGADYNWSLKLLERFKEAHPEIPTKSGLMVGLGETNDEIIEVMRDLRRHGVTMLTLGQYLQPSRHHLPVQRYVSPEEFEEMKAEAMAMGFTHAACGPFVRSSYHADLQAKGMEVK